MPVDLFDDEDDNRKEMEADAKRGAKEFDCPGCSANNPVDAALQDRDEVMCNYCGTEWKVSINDSGKLKMREM